MTVGKREIVRECKLRGLAIRADAAQALTDLLVREAEPGTVLRSLVEAVRQRVERGETSSRVVDVETVRSAFGDYFQEEVEEEVKVTKHKQDVVVDAWSTPRLAYDSSARRFSLEKCSSAEATLADRRASALRARYELAWQRVVRDPLFAARGSNDGKKKGGAVELSRLDALRGTTGKRLCVLGILAQVEEKVMYLEDPHTLIRADFTGARHFGGYFAEGMVVVCEGALDVNGTFVVDSVGHPPPETRQRALRAIGVENSVPLSPNDGKLCSWIIIAEPHLDAPLTLSRLRSVLSALVLPAVRRARLASQTDSPAVTVVLVGDFLSQRALGRGAAKALREAQARFAELGDLIVSREFDLENGESLASSAGFVFVPGPNDILAGAARTLPRPRLAASLVEPFLEKLREKAPAEKLDQNVHFSTSPCRMRFADRELIIHREDALRKMRRLSARVLPPPQEEAEEEEEELEATEHLAKTLLDQGHLAPYAATISPTHWEFDHALRLYPAPDALAIIDASAPPFEVTYEKAAVFNPGSFALEGSFVHYKPATNHVQASKVP